MILGHIDNFATEKGLFPLYLEKGLAYLRDTDFSKLANGKHFIDGEKLFATISEYQPEAKEIRRAEGHRKYIDIQYIVSGEELIGYADLSDATVVLEDCLEISDAIFYGNVNNESDIHVTPGMYVVFFPWDIHRPCCLSKPGLTVRKVVIKIRVDEVLK